MKKLIWFLLFLSFAKVNAQKAYKITYKYDPPIRDGRTVKLIITDTVSYQYYDLKGFAPKKSETVFGNKVYHHSNYYLPSDKSLYSTMGTDKKHSYMFIVKVPEHKWIPVTDTKIISGYLCKGMLSISEKGDSTLVFYTDKLSRYGSPVFDCYDIPGLILEVTDQSRGLVLTATKIEEGDYKIIFPSKMEIVSEEERNRRVLANREINN